MELSTLDYYYLVQEWQHLVAGRIQKIYLKDRLLVLQIYNKQNYQVLCTDGKAFLSTAKLTFPANPPGFCLFLRKRIQGTRIQAIELIGFDRIIKITVSTKEGPYELIIELIDKINIILCKDNKIISAFETHSYTDRTIRGGVTYTLPPSRPAPWNADLEPLLGKEAAKAMAIELGLGGRYAEEICAKAGIERKEKVSGNHIETIKKEIETLRTATVHAVHNTKEALPFPFISKPGDWEATATFSEAIDSLERETLESHEEKVQEQQDKKQLTKQEKTIKAQQDKIVELEQRNTEQQRQGEAIYEHYTELSAFLDQLKKDWKELSFKDVKEKYKADKRVKALHHDGTIEIEV